MANFGPLAAEIVSLVWGAPAGFASWLRYCSDVAQRKPTKLCTMFGRLLRGYTIYTFLAAIAPYRNFAMCKIQFESSKSCALQDIGSVTARHSSSRPEPNFAAFSTGRHLYSAGRPSRWALAHIVVFGNGLPSPNSRPGQHYVQNRSSGRPTCPVNSFK